MPVESSPLLIRAWAHYRRGQAHEAHSLSLEVVRADPRNGDAFALLGQIATDRRAFDQGLDLYQRALAIEPGNAAWGAGLARCLIGLNRTGSALMAARQALALGPPDATVFDILGVVFSRAGDQTQAATCFRAAHRLAPDDPGHLLNLGWAEQYLGDFAAAEQAWRRCIALDPDNDRAMCALVQLAPQTAGSSLAAPLERLFERAAGDADRTLRIGHALAKLSEDLGDPLRSFDWLLRAKAAKAAGATSLEAWQNELFAAARATAPAPVNAAPGEPAEDPIFIFGLPRSGTTLVERIVSSHPSVVSAGEPMDIAILTRKLAGAPTRELIDGPTFSGLQPSDVPRLGSAYLASLRARVGPAARFTDKTPLNFLYAGLINAALPDARMVCLRRHPVDSCLAIFRQVFATGFVYYDWVYSLEATARFYLGFDALMSHWRATLPADRFIEVAYEDIVADHEGEARRLMAWLGLPWNDAVLAFHENAAPVATASAVQVRQQVYHSSVGRWKRYGDRLKPMTDILIAGGVLSAGEVSG